MADAFILEVQTRTKSGTNAAKAVRKEGLVPAVMYGHGEATQSLGVWQQVGRLYDPFRPSQRKAVELAAKPGAELQMGQRWRPGFE